MKLRKTSAVAGIILVAAFSFAGCGGGDDSSSDQVSAADKAALQQSADQVATAAKTGNSTLYCGMMQPSRVSVVFGSPAGCVNGMAKVVKQSGFSKLTIASATAVDDTHATVEFKELPGRPIKFIKENGQWYFDLSDTKPAAKSPGGKPNIQKARPPQSTNSNQTQ